MALTVASAALHPGGTVAVGDASELGADAALDGVDVDPDSLGFTTNTTTTLSSTTASTANAMVIHRDPCIRSLSLGMAKKLPGMAGIDAQVWSRYANICA
jgi:hypothetical protein